MTETQRAKAAAAKVGLVAHSGWYPGPIQIGTAARFYDAAQDRIEVRLWDGEQWKLINK